jgi:hypothetical protein
LNRFESNLKSVWRKIRKQKWKKRKVEIKIEKGPRGTKSAQLQKPAPAQQHPAPETVPCFPLPSLTGGTLMSASSPPLIPLPLSGNGTRRSKRPH